MVWRVEVPLSSDKEGAGKKLLHPTCDISIVIRRGSDGCFRLSPGISISEQHVSKSSKNPNSGERREVMGQEASLESWW